MRITPAKGVKINLMFEAVNGDVRCTSITSHGVNALGVPALLAKHGSLERWTLLAIGHLGFAALLETVKDVGDAETVSKMTNSSFEESIGAADRPGDGWDPDDKQGTVPIRRGERTNITESHLREVADIFLKARDAGEATLTAIVDHFGVSRRTASRWIGFARKVEYLPPAPHGRPKKSE